jgi:membrane protease subunit HflC
MMTKKLPLLLALAAAVLLLASQSLFVVHQTQKALLIRLGEPMDYIYGPGLHLKLPFIQNVVYFDARILDYEARSAEALTSDKKTIVLDNYARWRIVDPLQFYRALRTIPGAQARLHDTVYSELRAQVGLHTLTEVVSSERTTIMANVTKRTSNIMRHTGVEVIDVRIKRTDLPAENQQAIFGRMQAERERQARQYRSEGAEESTKIRSEANRTRTVILADANRQASILRGDGDAQAARLFADAVTGNEDFYAFQRGLEALKRSLAGNTKVIATPEDPLLRELFPAPPSR